MCRGLVTMSAVAVIPARYASSRFPGKPLARATGKYLIQHVYERVAQARGIDRVIVATDDERIGEAVGTFGAECFFTSPDHPSGTDRVAEVARQLKCDFVVNVQGDEPEIEPAAVEILLGTLGDSAHPMATLACSFANLRRQGIEADPSDPNRVKVVCVGGRALYFSRSLIPYPRNDASGFGGPYLHLGTYAYRRDFLLTLAELPPTQLERIEGLEQLRAIEHGYGIAVGSVERAAAGIDTPEDYAAFVARFRSAG